MAIEREGYEVVNGVRVRTSNISQAPSVKDEPKEKKVKTPPKANRKVEEPKKEDEDEKDN